ncbi:aldo/keto reductase [candidate division KSB1 bacterium]
MTGQDETVFLGRTVNRRRFIRDVSLGVAGSGMLLSGLAGDHRKIEAAAGLKKRPLGRSGLAISEISLGGHYDGLGWKAKGSKSQDLREKILLAAVKRGVNFLDTNYDYERESLGLALQKLKLRDKVFLATDVNQRWAMREDTKAGVLARFRTQLELLKTDHVELLRLTSYPVTLNLDAIAGYVDAALELRREGRVRVISLSNHNPDFLIRILNEFPEIDAIYTPYNYLMQGAAEKFFPLAAEKNIGVIVIKPFAKGAMFKLEEQRRQKPRNDIQERLQNSPGSLDKLPRAKRESIARANLRFILANPNVSCAIPGMETVAELEDNIGASGGEYSLNDGHLLKRQTSGWEANLPGKHGWMREWRGRA